MLKPLTSASNSLSLGSSFLWYLLCCSRFFPFFARLRLSLGSGVRGVFFSGLGGILGCWWKLARILIARGLPSFLREMNADLRDSENYN